MLLCCARVRAEQPRGGGRGTRAKPPQEREANRQGFSPLGVRTGRSATHRRDQAAPAPPRARACPGASELYPEARELTNIYNWK